VAIASGDSPIMRPDLRVTDQPQESSFFDIVNGDSVIAIPLFQRRYRWTKKHLTMLLEDISQVREGATDSYFLGIIVSINRTVVPGRPIPWDIVDGQQRLTTLYLLLLGAVDAAAKAGEIGWASRNLGTFLLVRPLADNPVNTKLVPSFPDRAQFATIWSRVMSNPGFANEATVAANPPRTPPPSGEPTGDMIAQFSRIQKEVLKLYEVGGLPALDSFIDVVANRLSFVAISLKDPTAAPKIFERLNNRAELVTVAELVRNEVFVRAPSEPTEVQNIFSSQWEPFAAQFQNIDQGLEKFLFPYGLIGKPSLKKADLFSHLRTRWQSLTGPAAIISDMRRYAPWFLALETGFVSPETPTELAPSLKRIYSLGKPSSVFSFVMQVTLMVVEGQLQIATAKSILDALECFLFRRAVCGIEPTGLHSVFKGMWSEMTGDNGPGVSVGSFAALIRTRPTVSWPDDTAFGEAILKGNLYDRRVVKFALAEFERSRPGETPIDIPWIEHILPQQPTDQWRSIFVDPASGQSIVDSVVHTWANLIPLSQTMNPALGQAGYEQKRSQYEDSMFATARELAREYSEWTPVTLAARAEQIRSWALARWPNPSAV
jgi:hypothetical protein